jgi:hypothetical protein
MTLEPAINNLGDLTAADDATARTMMRVVPVSAGRWHLRQERVSQRQCLGHGSAFGRQRQ